ncbi:MAG TPA: B12-binding domain-containing radical SAM protein, partial [Polyangia bacterium]|nr:B12-binding domain-containing radical SAM protein [Polyangia bacterium]
TETYAEAMATLRFLEEHQREVALYIVGEFDLTEGALVAQRPADFGVKETYRLDGDLLGTGLFYEEARPSKRAGEQERIDAALDELSRGWQLRRYPWAGSLSTAHTVYWYERFGPGVFRELARRLRAAELEPFGARAGEARARFDLDEVAASDEREQEIWRHLVRERRHVSRAAYHALAAELAPLRPKPRRYRFRAGSPPAAGRRPSNAPNSAR